MGMFDTINVFMECPYCGTHGLFDAQTKDLENMLFVYNTYNKDDMIDRTKLKVFKQTPEDISAQCWKNQDQRSRALATIPEGFENLKYVNVTADCNSIKCQFDGDRDWIIHQGSTSGFGRFFRGKIKIEDNMLVGKIYDIEKDDLTEHKLNKWKKLYPKQYKQLMKEYKHEPIAARMWNRKTR